jgi:hypothetical protein
MVRIDPNLCADYSARKRLLCSPSKRPDMLNFPHYLWLKCRGTVKADIMGRSRSDNDSGPCRDPVGSAARIL